MKKQIYGFVPARGGSTRVPGKNLKDVGGLPMFLRACYNLNQILPKDHIVVDSDDEKILELARSHGFQALIRPAELATNATDGNSFFAWEVSNYPDADIYIQHLPPMPFCSKETLQKGLNAIQDEGYDSIVIVGKEHFYLWDADRQKPLYDIRHIPNSYTLKETVFETMGLYMITAQAHQKDKLRIGEHYKMIEINKIEQIDVNYPEDFELAQAVANGLPAESCYSAETLLKGGVQNE